MKKTMSMADLPEKIRLKLEREDGRRTRLAAARARVVGKEKAEDLSDADVKELVWAFAERLRLVGEE